MKKVEDNVENVETCKNKCGICPSYPRTEEWLFCARSKSNQKIAKKGCLCPSCPVYLDSELKGNYFCVTGSPK